MFASWHRTTGTAALPIALASLVFLSLPVVASSLEQVDDRTAFDPVTGEFVERVVDTPVEPAPPAPAEWAGAQVQALTDGVVGCSTTDTGNPFDLATNVQAPSINLLPEGNYPYDANINFAGSEVWIPGASGDGVIVLDRATNTIAERITVGDYPVSVVFTQDGSRALVSNRSSRDMSVVSTSTYSVTSTLDFGLTSGFGPGNAALDPSTGEIWAVRWFDGELYRIAPDGSSVLDTYTIGNSLWQVVVAPDGEYVYVTDRNTDQVRVFDPVTETVFDNVDVGDDPWGLDVTADGSQLVVACEDDATVHFIDTSTFLATSIDLPGTADPRDVDILDATNTAYVCGGTVTGAGSPVYLIDLEALDIVDSFASSGTNTNVIAVQPQMGTTSTGVQAAAVPGALALTLGVSPNPFNPQTTVSYSLSRGAAVRLAIYSPGGQLVATLADGQRAAGPHRASWDGRSANGGIVAGGVYFVRLDAGADSRAIKVVLAK